MVHAEISSVEPRTWLYWPARGVAHTQPAVSAGGGYQRLRTASIILARMEAMGKYQERD